MKEETAPSFDAYLDAKRALDERSLHGPTWRAYLDYLKARAASGRPPRVLELGPGLGSMLDRTLRDLASRDNLASGDDLASGGAFAAGDALSYIAVDSSQESIEALRSRFMAPHPAGKTISLETRCGDAQEELRRLAAEGRRFDAIVSHAFADLADIPRLTEAASAALVPRGVFYNSLVFDGVTAFIPVPADEAEADERYIAAYHRSMRRTWNGRPLAGDSVHADGASGRRLLAHLAAAPWRVESAGPSDWIVLPRRRSASDGAAETRADEETVVAAMLGFFAQSVGPEFSDARSGDARSGGARPYDGGLYDDNWQAGAEREDFAGWLAAKRERLARGELGFYAHNLDVLAVLRD